MSLEIREMIVRSTLTDGHNGKTQNTAATGHSTPEIDVEYIIEQCIERIAEMIREENER